MPRPCEVRPYDEDDTENTRQLRITCDSKPYGEFIRFHEYCADFNKVGLRRLSDDAWFRAARTKAVEQYESFVKIATDLGQVLLDSPPEILNRLPQEMVATPSHFHRWLWFLFEVSWRREHRLLQSTPETLLRDWSGDLVSLPEVDLSFHCVSNLDLFDATKWSIDLLLCTAPESESESEILVRSTESTRSSAMEKVQVETTRDIEVTREVELTQDGAQQEPYVFRKRADTWNVAFKNEIKEGIKDSRGMRHLHQLLETPNPVKAIPATLLSGQDTARTVDPEDVADFGHGTSEAVLDEDAKKNYRERLEGIEEDLEGARRNRDQGRAQQLEEEKQRLVSELSAATGIGGKPRTLGTPELTKAGNSVKKANDRAILRLNDKGLKGLAGHLKETIRREGNAFAYRCENPPKWLL